MTQFAQRLTAALLLGLLACTAVAGQDVEPAWLKVERADRYSSQGEFGRAILLYREALQLSPGSAEALFGLGRAFASAGDYPVAEYYLKEARAQSDRLRVPASLFDILYSLSHLYEVQRRFSDLEEVLTEIVATATNQAPTGKDVPADPPTLARFLSNEGLDRLLVLYRGNEDGATEARGALCELLVGLGRYDTAVNYGVVAVQQQLSTVIEAVLARDPSFTYSTVRGTLEAAALYPETRDYLSKTSMFRTIYYLAAAEYSAGRSGTAFSLWRLLSDLPVSGQIAVRARVQLSDPRDEPLLVPPS